MSDNIFDREKITGEAAAADAAQPIRQIPGSAVGTEPGAELSGMAGAEYSSETAAGITDEARSAMPAVGTVDGVQNAAPVHRRRRSAKYHTEDENGAFGAGADNDRASASDGSAVGYGSGDDQVLSPEGNTGYGSGDDLTSSPAGNAGHGGEKGEPEVHKSLSAQEVADRLGPRNIENFRSLRDEDNPKTELMSGKTRNTKSVRPGNMAQSSSGGGRWNRPAREALWNRGSYDDGPEDASEGRQNMSAASSGRGAAMPGRQRIGAASSGRDGMGSAPLGRETMSAASRQRINAARQNREGNSRESVGYAPGRMSGGGYGTNSEGRTTQGAGRPVPYGTQQRGTRPVITQRESEEREKKHRGLTILVILLLIVGLFIIALLLIPENQEGFPGTIKRTVTGFVSGLTGNRKETSEDIISFEADGYENTTAPTDVTISLITGKSVSGTRLVDEGGTSLCVGILKDAGEETTLWNVSWHLDDGYEGNVTLELLSGGAWKNSGKTLPVSVASRPESTREPANITDGSDMSAVVYVKQEPETTSENKEDEPGEISGNANGIEENPDELNESAKDLWETPEGGEKEGIGESVSRNEYAGEDAGEDGGEDVGDSAENAAVNREGTENSAENAGDKSGESPAGESAEDSAENATPDGGEDSEESPSGESTEDSAENAAPDGGEDSEESPAGEGAEDPAENAAVNDGEDSEESPAGEVGEDSAENAASGSGEDTAENAEPNGAVESSEDTVTNVGDASEEGSAVNSGENPEQGSLSSASSAENESDEPAPEATEAPKLTVKAGENADPSLITTAVIYNGTKKTSEYNRAAKDLITMPVVGEYTKAPMGVLTFRSDAFRQNAACGTVEGKVGLVKVWETEAGSVKGKKQTYYGIGYIGQPAIVKWSKQVRELSDLYDGKKEKTGLKEVIVGGMDGYIYFLDLDDGSNTRNVVRVGYPMRGSASAHPGGAPYFSIGQYARQMAKGTGKIGLRQYNLYTNKEMTLIDGLDGSNRRAFNRIGSFETSALIDRTSDTLITAGTNGLLYTINMGSTFDFKLGLYAQSPSMVLLKTKAKGESDADTAVEASIAMYDRYVFYADMGGILRCVDTNNMKTMWAVDTGDSVESTPALDFNGTDGLDIYTANILSKRKSGDAQVRRYDALSGDEKWTFEVPVRKDTKNKTISGFLASPVVGQNSLSDLVFYTVNNLNENGMAALKISGESAAVIALKKTDGSLVWAKGLSGLGYSSPVAVYDGEGNGWIIQCAGDGSIVMLEGLTGKTVSTLNVKGSIEGSPAVYNKMMVVGTTEKGANYIYGIRLTEAEQE